MCGLHSEDQCTTAGFGSVERATEVVRPGRGPIPPLCGGLVRRPVRRCSSLQINTIIPKCSLLDSSVTVGYYSSLVRHSAVRSERNFLIVESKMGNRTTMEKTAVRSGREREKENDRENVENARSKLGDRDAEAIRIGSVHAFKRKMMRAGLN